MATDIAQLGKLVKRLRQKRGLSQRELADEAGLTVNYLSLLENGKRSVGLRGLDALGDVLGVPAGVLLFYTSLSPSARGSNDTDKLGRALHSAIRDALALLGKG